MITWEGFQCFLFFWKINNSWHTTYKIIHLNACHYFTFHLHATLTRPLPLIMRDFVPFDGLLHLCFPPTLTSFPLTFLMLRFQLWNHNFRDRKTIFKLIHDNREFQHPVNHFFQRQSTTIVKLNWTALLRYWSRSHILPSWSMTKAPVLQSFKVFQTLDKHVLKLNCCFCMFLVLKC